MTQPTSGSPFELQFPQSIGTFDSYPQAQKAVDYLADEKFAVENIVIVGTDLRLVERVTGRRTWGTVLRDSALSGVGTGLIVALIFMLFLPSNPVALFAAALGFGVFVSMVFGALAYAFSAGKRDFNSIAQTVATKYEVLCEHTLAEQAREMLQKLPGVRASQFE